MEEIHYLLGHSCNLNCDFCFWDKRFKDSSLEFKKKIIDNIVQTRIKKVTISGGEPTSNKDLIEIIKYMHSMNLEIILHTNGLLINEKLAKKLSKYISRISLTFDGSDTQTSYKMRGNKKISTHTAFLINFFNKLGIETNIKTLVTKINLSDIANIGYIIRNLPVKYWKLLEFIPLNRGKLNKDKFYISKEDFNKKISEIKKLFPDINIKTKYFNNDSKYCFIAPNGDVYTYKNNFDILIGNLKEKSLPEIIKKINNA